MSIVIAICIVILAVAIVVGLVRVLTAKDMGSRAVVGDLVYFSAIGMLTFIGMHVSSSIVLDGIFLSSMVGILATIALSRILTRGYR
ncbi:transporter [Brevibacterium sp.]|uniref:transporter n=1 Tax=Brevibacterium sp. TaxID=1701 RepID=UPI002811D733|nr:transporter [Brevibacterium sp.]